MVLVAVGQICSTASMTHNLAQCQVLIRRAVAAGAKALFLPEASDYIAASPSESLSLSQPTSTSPFLLGLQASVREHSLPINVGVHEPTDPPSDRIRNTLLWLLPPDGRIAHRYQKVHLFDIDLRPDGPEMKESKTTQAGDVIEAPFAPFAPNASTPAAASPSLSSPPSSSTPTHSPADKSSDHQQQQLHFGSAICFDLRFPELSLNLRRRGAHVLLYPSAFTVPTGTLHWEVLLRARAVESQCWVVAAAQCGRHNEKRVSYGEGMVVDPQGRVVGRLGRVGGEQVEGEVVGGREPELLVVEIEMAVVEKARRMIPLEGLRRTDVYPEM